jgi:hypothetical protein
MGLSSSQPGACVGGTHMLVRTERETALSSDHEARRGKTRRRQYFLLLGLAPTSCRSNLLEFAPLARVPGTSGPAQERFRPDTNSWNGTSRRHRVVAGGGVLVRICRVDFQRLLEPMPQSAISLVYLKVDTTYRRATYDRATSEWPAAGSRLPAATARASTRA